MNQIEDPAGFKAVVREPFDYSALSSETADDLRNAAGYISHRMRNATKAILDIGAKLLQVKERLDHGQFGKWIEAEFQFSIRSAQRYMATAEGLGDKSDTVSYLPVGTAYALASASQPVRERVLHQIEIASREERPLPEDNVVDLLARAKEEDAAAKAEARRSPQQRASDNAKAARRQREEARLAEEDRQLNEERLKRAIEAEKAVIAIIDIIRDRCAADIPHMIELLAKANGKFGELRSRLENPFGIVSTSNAAARPPRPWFEELQEDWPRCD